jgi:hypothetical protein
MHVRLLVTALAYGVFLLALLLFPPFHDGLHHLYTWQPNENQLVDMLPAQASGEWYRAHYSELLAPDRLRLVFESIIGLVSAALLFFLLEIVASWRNFHNVDKALGKSGWLSFLLTRE